MATTVLTPDGAAVRARQLGDTFARAVLVLLVVAMAALKFRPFGDASGQFLLTAVASALLVQFAYKPSRMELAWSAVIGLALYALAGQMAGLLDVSVGAWPVRWLGAQGIATMLVLGWRAVRQQEGMQPFLLAFFCPMLVMLVVFSLELMVAWQPVVYDRNLYHFDQALGGVFSFTAANWFQAYPWLKWSCFGVYAALPTAMVVFLLAHFRHPERYAANGVLVIVATGLIGFAFYQICPGMGPIYMLGKGFWSSGAPGVAWGPAALGNFARNAVPSLHATWAMLLWWNGRRAGRVAAWAWAVFLLMTLLATQGLGEHYIVDLIVAVPFAVGVQALCEREWGAAAAGLGVAGAFCVYLRLASDAGWMPAWGAWLMTLAALLTALAALRRLGRGVVS